MEVPPVEEAIEVSQETSMTGANNEARQASETRAEDAAGKTRAQALIKAPCSF